jgi:outer membrane receptor for ferrienterochelin and colicins
MMGLHAAHGRKLIKAVSGTFWMMTELFCTLNASSTKLRRPIKMENAMKEKLCHVLFATLITCSWCACANAEQTEEEELAQSYGDKSLVSIATGNPQPISRAPSVASVITAEDMKAIGAADIDEALETVPGLHVGRSPIGYDPIYTIRGVYSQYNPEVLMLVNGIPITAAFFNDRSIVWGGMPTDNIERIEVIRGPGSALYGADAVAGVINLITKTSSDIDGTEFGLRAGSFDSHDAWVQYGGMLGSFKAAAYLRGGHTSGSNQIIQADALSPSPYNPGTPFSLAPGQLNLGYSAIDSRVDLSNEKWQLRAGYQQRTNGETGAGVALALDPTGRVFGERKSADLTYHDKAFTPNLELTAQTSFLYITEQSDVTLYPAGTNFGLGGFPDGVIGDPYRWERHLRFNMSGSYTGYQQHKITSGVGTQDDDMYRIEESRNYQLQLTPVGYLPAPLGSLVDVTGTAPYITPHSRRVSYVYAQDEWSLARDWYLTAGLRYDHYSDFGGTTNPRVALVWETAYNLTSKLLYGRAFRPPSFAELYNINNPVAQGNPDLRPETNNSEELAFSWQATGKFLVNFNIFHYQLNDMIAFILDPASGISTAQNAGQQHGQGTELEMTWDAARNLRLTGNFALQHSIDDATNQDSANAPRQHAYARADWRFTPLWSLDTQLNYIADRKRAVGDPRPPIADYQTVDLTLRTNQKNNWDIAFKAFNIFGADAREPSPSPLIPYDLPTDPRSWRVELSHKL